MGFVEMVKQDQETKRWYIVYIDEEGEMVRENAHQCDYCHEYRRDSMLTTVFVGGGDDWLDICNLCKVHK